MPIGVVVPFPLFHIGVGATFAHFRVGVNVKIVCRLDWYFRRLFGPLFMVQVHGRGFLALVYLFARRLPAWFVRLLATKYKVSSHTGNRI